VLRRDLPERVSVLHRVGDGRSAGVGSGVGVEEVDDDGGYQQSHQPPPSVYRGVFHPGKIIEDLSPTNGVFWDDRRKLLVGPDVYICSKIVSSRSFPDRRTKWDLAVIY
jgi:hypothetical protein